jgi:hypothetical protein
LVLALHQIDDPELVGVETGPQHGPEELVLDLVMVSNEGDEEVEVIGDVRRCVTGNGSSYRPGREPQLVTHAAME